MYNIQFHPQYELSSSSRVSEMMQKSTKALEPFTTGSWTWTSSNTKALGVSWS